MVLFEGFLIWTLFVYLMEFVSFKKTYEFVKNARSNINKKYRNPNKFVSVIIPYKGLEYELEENIKAVLNQDYKNYEVIFVVDNFKDPSYKVLKKFLRNKRIRLLKQKKIKTCSHKVASQITAVEKARGDILLFADSDIRPGKNWIKDLITPLQDKQNGVSVVYVLNIPLNNSWTTCLGSMWFRIGLGSMFGKHSFVMGGSFAMTKDVFNKLDIKKKWQTAISDDMTITHFVRGAGLKIYFALKAVPVCFLKTNWKELKDWTNRQMFFIRHFDFLTWKRAFIIYGFFNLIPLSGFISIILGFVDFRFFILGIMLLVTQIFNIIRNYFRDRIFEQILPQYKQIFDKYRMKCFLTDFLVKFVVMYNLFKTRNMNSIIWKGKEYQVK